MRDKGEGLDQSKGNFKGKTSKGEVSRAMQWLVQFQIQFCDTL
jgi:hypothetical protein